MLIVNSILSLNILLGYIPYNELRSIALKLEIELAKIIVEDAVSDILYRIKPRVLSAKYKKPIYIEV